MSLDLSRFIYSNDLRDWMRQPFEIDGVSYATNGHLLICVFRPLGYLPAQKNVPAGILELANLARTRSADSGGWIPMSAVEIDKRECVTCDGSGHLYPCDECDGEGSFAHGTHEYQCLECDGAGGTASEDEGSPLCTTCYATGVHHYAMTNLGDAEFTISGMYAALIRDVLPDAEVKPSADAKEYFIRFDGGVGLVKGMRRVGVKP